MAKKRTMRTFGEILLARFEVLPETLKETPKQIVLMEDAVAKCVKTKAGYSIRAGRNRYGKGKTEEDAWMDAVINILYLDLRGSAKDGRQR